MNSEHPAEKDAATYPCCVCCSCADDSGNVHDDPCLTPGCEYVFSPAKTEGDQ